MKDAESSDQSDFPLTRNADKTPAASAAPARSTGAAGRPRTGWTVVKWTLASLVCLGCMASGAILGNFASRNMTIASILRAMLTHPITTILHPGDPLATFTVEKNFPADKQHSITILVMGCDVDYIGKRVGGYAIPVPVKDSLGRSDAMMLARLNFDTSTIEILSIPRDTAVRFPGRGSVLHKINAAHAMGGPQLSLQTVQNAFGIQPDYYVTIHFDAFKQMVDAIGGVDLTVHRNLDFVDKWGGMNIHLKPGFQHLDGYHAMGYVRVRHVDDDLMRAQRQHEFLEALRGKVTQPDSFLKLPNVLNAITDNMHSDLTMDQLLTLGNFARKLPKQNIALATLPSVEGPSFVYVKRREAEAVIRKMFFDNNPATVLALNIPERGDQIASARHSASELARHRRHPKRRARQTDAAPTPDTGALQNADMVTPDGASTEAGNGDSSTTGDKSGSGTDGGSKPNGDGGGDNKGDKPSDPAPSPAGGTTGNG